MVARTLRIARPILALLAAATLLGARVASATPLAGTYVIGSGGNYASFAAAATDLIAQGVSAPVTFQVKTGTYTESLSLTAITGASSSNRVTFVAQSGVASDVVLQAASLSGTGSDAPIQLNGAQFLTFNQLTIQSSSSAASSNGGLVWMTGTSSNNSFANCVFTTVGANRTALRIASGTADQLQVSGCQITLSASSSYAVQGTGAGTQNNFQFQSNTVTSTAGVGNTGLYSTMTMNSAQIIGNTFSFGTNGTAINYAGSVSSGDVIRGNRITGVGTGLSLNNMSGGCLVANNFIQASSAAVSISSPAGMTLAFNNFLATGTTSCVIINGGSAGSVTLRNNVIACPAGAIPFVSTSSGPPNPDYDDFYTTGVTAVTIGGVNYATIGAYRSATGLEFHGIAANPGFVSTTDLHVTAPALNNTGTPLGSVLDDIDGDVRSLTTPDIGADEFSTALTPMAGTYTVGASGAYATLPAAAADLNVRGISGPVSFLIQTGTYTGTTLFTPVTGANAANRIRLAPQSGVASNVVLQAAAVQSSGSDAVLRLEGARYFDVDSLTIQPTTPATGSNCAVAWLLYASQVDRFQGCVVNVNNANCAGIRAPSTTVDSLSILNCQFTLAASATNSDGVQLVSGGTSNAMVFSGNSCIAGAASQTGFYTGIPGNGLSVLNNSFTMAGGIGITIQTTGTPGAVIRGNKIIASSSGISAATLTTPALIANNMIQSTGAPLTVAGPSGMTIAFNSLQGLGAQPAIVSSAGAAGGLTLRNNILASAGGASAIQVGSGVLASADYDDYYITGPTVATVGATSYVTLSALQSGTGFETHAVAANPGFVSSSDLHSRAPAINNTGTPVAAVLDDIDGDVRSASTPDIGADEFSSSVTPMAGTYTVGASGTYATPAAAAADIELRGLSGPVSFLIQSGTYSGTTLLSPVAGANALTRVRFVSQSGVQSDVVLQAPSLIGDGSDAALRFEGGRYVDFDSLTIQSTAGGGGSGSGVVWLVYAPIFNRFQNCKFTSSPSNCSCIRVPSGRADSLQVIGCQLNVAGNNNYGIEFSGVSTCTAMLLLNSTLTSANSNNFGFNSDVATVGAVIQGNTFSLPSGTAIGFTSSATGATVRANRMTGSFTGMTIANPGGGALIANNMVQGSGVALSISGPTGATVAFNTLETTGASATLSINGGTAASVTVKDNVIASLGGGYAVSVTQTSSLAASDYNDLYSPGQPLATIGGTSYATLATLQAGTTFEAHSIAANPGFVSSTDLHCTAPALNNAGTPLAAVLDDIDGDVRSVSAPDIGADEYSPTLAPLAGTYLVGASGVYATPAAAAADLGVRGVSGPVSFVIQSGTYTGTVRLTPPYGANGLNRARFVSQSGVPGDVIIQAPSLQADGSDAAVRFDGGRYIDLDSVTVRSSTSSPGAPGAVIWLTNTCTGTRLQGCTVNSVASNHTGIRGSGAFLDSTQINNCQITIPGSADYGLELTVPGSANGMVISGNTFTIAGSNVEAIYVNIVMNGMVIRNQVMTLSSGFAIELNSASSNVTVRGNRISGAGSGIVLNGLSNVLVANNMVQGNSYGLSASSTSALAVEYNSFNATGAQEAIYDNSGTAGTLTLKNNVISCSGGSTPVYLASTGSVLAASDYNDYFTNGPNIAQVVNTQYPTLAAYRTATGMDAHSVNINPAYTSSTDLHTAAPGLDGAATPIAAVLDDIDGQLRNATTPDIGADEFTIGTNDVTPPNTSIVSGPADGGWTNSSSATIGWSGIDDISLPATLRFSYSMDGAAYSTPAYPTSQTFNSLTEGSHTFSVYAIDEVGNIDPTPATRSFSVDVTSPDTQILTGPLEGSTVAAANVSFTITGTDNLTPSGQLSYAYNLDGGAWNSIGASTSFSIPGISNGAHTIQVRAIDLAGNVDATPATRHITVATVYDLTADWSDAANPNGPWAYREGTNLLAHQTAWQGLTGDFSTAQPAWARSASGNTITPGIFRSAATVVPVHDWLNGDVLIHATDPVSGVGGGNGNVTWTAPIAATIAITGAAWIGRDIGRSENWTIYLNGVQLSSGTVSSGDSYSESSPFNIATGSGGAGALSGLAVGVGDVVKLEVTRNGASGDYVGVRMQIQAVATTGTPPQPVIVAGPAAAGWSGANTAFTWTLGAHSAPPANIRYATRLDAAATGAFLVDTTLALSGLTQGSHTLWIIARDNLALRDSTSRTWTVDVTAPTVAIATGPLEGGYSNPAPVFTWSGTDNLTSAAQLRYSYSLDAAAFTPPITSTTASLFGLTVGAHTLAVHSLDLAGNVSADVTRHWTVDSTPPETQITSGPADAATLGVNSATYGFTGTDNITPTANLSYQTQLDGGAWSATSGATISTLSGLGDGSHVFAVRAVDQGGNVDPTPATRTFTVDALGPALSILTGPANNSCQSTTSASFTWTATDIVTPQPALSYSTHLDGAAPSTFSTVTSASLTGLTEGQHTFTVQAQDGAAHITTVARTFQVDFTTPVVNAPTTRVLDLSRVQVQCSATDQGGVTQYHIQVSSDPTFATVAADLNIYATGQYIFTGTPGSSYYARAQASDCAGNTTAFSGPSNVAILANLPNLTASNVQAAPTLIGGQSTLVTYTINNVGLGATNVPSWSDYIYLSPTSTYNSSTATLLGQKPNLSVLAPGEAYTSSNTVTVPIGTSGTWYMLVMADGADVQSESSGSDNVAASSAIAVSIGAFADLHTIAVVAPPTALSSDVINVNWTVRNDGTGRTNATDWYDTILLSTDPNFDYTVLNGNLIRPIDLPLAQIHHVGALDPNASYAGSTQVQLPGSFGGKRYIIVASDLNMTSVNQAVPQQGNVFENQLDINALASDSMIVTQEQPSDLTVDAVTSGATGVSGGTIAVSFTVGNHGFNATPANTNWADRVWYSTDNALDGSDVLMGTFFHSGGLALGATYSTSANLALPQGFTGTYFVIVQTDAGGSVPEFSETNNTGIAAQTASITLAPWANLVPAAVSVSDTIPAGGSGTANWSVSDNGAASASGAWTDNVEIGTSPTWIGGLTSIGSQRGTHALAHGQSYAGSATVTVPTTYAGTYYVFARTDALNEVWEQTDEGDNAVLLGAVTVTPHAPVDLVVSNVTAPSIGTGAQNVNVSWSVTNQGTGATLNGSWTEDVWLSSDATWSADDIQLSSTGHSGTLLAGGHYSRTLSVTLPQGLNGTYYVIVRSDPSGSTGDAALANNAAAAPGTITVSSPPPPQLTVSNVVVSASPTAGQPAQVSFDVHNVGAGPVPNATWYSAVYLSQDPWLDGSDVLLGTIAGSPGLAGGASENRSLSVTMPAYASGPYYVIAFTDSRSEVWENGAESDNTAFTTTTVTLPPPADLVVQNVLVPGAAIPGQPVTVNFTLYNQGVNPAVGTLTNAVYVSSDAAFVATDDPLVGVQTTSINLAPGGSAQLALRVVPNRPLRVESNGVTNPLPPISPGNYYAIVRANIQANIRELVSDNDTGVSPGTIQTDVPSLTLGSGSPFALTIGQSSFYKVTVPAGMDLTLSANSDVPDATNEMYVAYARVPQLSDFDFSGPAGFTANPSVLVPQTQAGTYYVMVIAKSLGTLASSENMTLLGQTLPFSLTSNSPTHGGVNGRVTIHVRGAGLRSTTTFDLEQSGIPRATATVATFTNSTDLLTRFDLTGVPLGNYDLAAHNGASTVVFPNAFVVEVAQPIAVAIATENADLFRRTATGNFTIHLQNTSNQDVPVVQARALFPSNSSLKSISSDAGLFRLTQLDHGLSGVSGDQVMLHRADGTDSLWAVDVIGANLAPGESRTFSLAIAGFVSSPYSVRVLAAGMTMNEFLSRQAAAVEAARRALLTVSAGLPDSLPLLAADAYQFRDQTMRATYVLNGVISESDLEILPPRSGVLPSPTYLQPAGPQSLLDDLAAGGPCPQPAAIPECKPDVAPPGSALPACASLFSCDVLVPLDVYGGLSSRISLTTTTGFDLTKSVDVRIVVPCDPNLMTGPAGFGTEHWVKAAPLSYRVDFENLPGVASAPAQVVRVSVPIDPGLDITTFRVGEMGFGGSNVITVPPNRTSFSSQATYPSIQLAVLVTAGVNPTTRLATWTFTTIDPATGAPPTNPLYGFLPVNDLFGSGTGYVTFTAQPATGLASGSTVRAQGTIQFDANTSIPTVSASNRVDDRPPTSLVLNPIQPLGPSSARVSWNSVDDSTGAGLSGAALYMKTDNGTFAQVGTVPSTGNSLDVPVVSGHTYGFYTLSSDNAGNTEPGKSSAEAILAAGGTSDVHPLSPRVTLLHPNYPNPFRGTTTIWFDLASAEAVTLEVFDLQGRRVTEPLEAKHMEPGSYRIELHALPGGPGVYFYRLHAGAYESARKLVMLK